MAHQGLEIDLVHEAVARAKRSMVGVFVFSFVVNLLLLTSPLFMLQVYDRVLISQSGSTLMGLLAVALFALTLLMIVEVIRNLLLNRISVRFDDDLGKITFSQVMSEGSVSKPMHDLNNIRSFLNAPFLLALFDAPWLPLFLGLVYMLHPMLGHIGLVGAIVLFVLALSNEGLTREAASKAAENFGAANAFVEHSARNKDAIVGMGMLPSLTTIWSTYQGAGLGYQTQSSDRNAYVSSIAKVIRQIVQVAILAMGAFLTIEGHTTAGVMIAASIIIGRALAPVEQSIQGWRSLSRVKEAYASLQHFLKAYEAPKPGTTLPIPKGQVSVQNVVALAANPSEETAGQQPVLKNLSFRVEAGESIGAGRCIACQQIC